MRDILFKAKRKDNSEWAEGSFVRFINGGAILPSKSTAYYPKGKSMLCSPECYEIDPETVCQYTGQNDSEGRKIFEGDTVIVNSCGIDEEDGYGVVSWDNEEAMFIIKFNNDLEISFMNVFGYKCEVIGNIFDNPEPLEVTK